MEYWEQFSYVRPLYQNTSSVYVVQYSNSEANKPRYGVIKQTPLSTETRREAAIHHTLSYIVPGVVRQRDMIEYQGSLIEIMDFADNGSLHGWIAGRAPLSREEYLLLMHSLMKAVAELHEQSWTHGNISSENFVLTSKHEWKLIDFGQTRKIRRGAEPLNFDPERVTKFAMKPESMFLEDIWWLGLACYWAGTKDSNISAKPAPGQHWLLDKYVEAKLSVHYDSHIVWLVQQMLSLSEGERGSLRYLMDVIESLVQISEPERAVAPTALCAQCKTEAPGPSFTLQLTCSDVLCFACFKTAVTAALSGNCSLTSVPCPVCQQSLDYDLLMSYRTALPQDTRIQLSIRYYLTFTASCQDLTCSGRFPTYKPHEASLRAYNAKCLTCGKVCCSYCKQQNGHERNGYEAACPQFKPEALTHIFAN